MVFPGAHLFRTSSEPQFGAVREGGGTREAGSTVAESLVVLIGWVRTRFGEGGEGSLIVNQPGKG